MIFQYKTLINWDPTSNNIMPLHMLCTDLATVYSQFLPPLLCPVFFTVIKCTHSLGQNPSFQGVFSQMGPELSLY